MGAKQKIMSLMLAIAALAFQEQYLDAAARQDSGDRRTGDTSADHDNLGVIRSQ